MILLLMFALAKCNEEKLSYIYKESTHSKFTIKDEKVIFQEHIAVKNNTNGVLTFTMKADIAKEKKQGLTKEKYAYAYEDHSDRYRVFKILPNEKKFYDVKFIAKHGDKNTKTDRNPLDNVIFELR